ncbi:guanosine-5'-triphosphate,3'-diphosphate pyrophosphatase [Alteromonas sp. ASW11-36]|uniref:Guanosine-5'-triphosphate,3'-diphosphate pyrophosphatase n=1 Tax=Alteromonas arenosi TaxID=3055817 RepID=A0ABT7SZE3_9ALTE|nr:guanosine-5'-triphosphate,3'-diphosphate pyrophosphatase [Alteromonas sp. ASW11-36]MDM7861562.1 guanosine-5'-triphosphate,3'-diphosphate pyrophosphatase [Alteromonas sp. ASW11-36]
MNNTLGLPTLRGEYYAAIDLGSNSFHMVIVHVVNGSVQIVGKIKQKVRLAAGLNDQMELDNLSIERGLNCLRSFAERLEDIPRSNIKIVATATLRLAVNASEFLRRGEEVLGMPIPVISGEEEARQIYLGVAYTSANQGSSLVIDIGGASTEIIFGNDMNPVTLTSLDMGCVTFMERHFAGGSLAAECFEKAQTAATELLVPVREEFLCFDWQNCLGASGTPQAIIEILVNQGISDSIRLDYLYELRRQCIECGSMDKLQIDGLSEARRAIFPSGLAILICLFEQLEIKDMNISGGALREGLIYGMLDSMQDNDRREQTLNQTMQRFRIDVVHARNVHKVAKMLCEQVCEQTGICNFDTNAVLEAASMLHELGLHIDYKLYHQHGAYVLSHIDLPGYTQLQKTTIRDLVQGHRQNINVESFAGYHPEVKPMIINLLRILRLAVVLCIRRADLDIPKFELAIEDQHWRLTFPDGWLKTHPLLSAELSNESWLQHKAGWQLSCN